MANKDLTVNLRLNTSHFEKRLNQIVKRLDNINRTLNNSNNGYNKSNTIITRITDKMSEWVKGANKVNSAMRSTNSTLSSMWNKLKGIAGTYLGLMGVKAVVGVTDALVGSQNKLNYTNAGILGDAGYNADGTYSNATLDATQDALDKIYTSSQKVRSSYTDMVSNVSKTMALSGDAFGGNIDNAIRFQEIMAEAYTVGGASAQEMESSMYQLTQALGAGILAGDELRSVREGAPLAYQAIEKFEQGIYGTTDSLKDMASQGKITSDIVIAGIMDAGSTLDKAFAQTRQTFGQTFTQIKSAATRAFQPVMEMLTDTLQKAIENGLVQKFETFFTNVAKVVMIVFTTINNVVKWIADNWYWLQVIIITVCVVAILYLTTLAAQAVITGLIAFASFILGLSPLYLWIIAIGLVLAAIVYLAGGVQEACGVIVGVMATAFAIVCNIVVAAINAILQFLWAVFVERWIGIIEWVLNVFNGGFNSFGDMVKNLLGNIISWFLSLGQVVTKIIDAIFGTDWSSGLESLKGKLTSWGKNETAITLNREAPGLDRVGYGDTYNGAYQWGVDKSTALTDKLSGLTSLDGLGSKLGLDFSGMGSFPTTGAEYDDANKLLGNIDDNTGAIADSMDLTKEDLEYLRKVADMEWKKEFTTASINVKMDNNIQSEADYESFVTRLRDDIYEEMVIIADGAYSY